jgi:hypothetical protein
MGLGLWDDGLVCAARQQEGEKRTGTHDLANSASAMKSQMGKARHAVWGRNGSGRFPGISAFSMADG